MTPREERVVVWGVCRNEPDARKAHAYVGDSYHSLEGPLCPYGWNRSGGFGFSIFRNNVGRLGRCVLCESAIMRGDLTPVEPKARKTRWA